FGRLFQPSKKYTVREKCIVVLPGLIVFACIFVGILMTTFCKDGHLFQLLPNSWQNPGTFTLLSLVELYVVWLNGIASVLFLLNCILFFENAQKTLKKEIDSLRNLDSRNLDVEQCISQCVRHQLLIQVFNEGYSRLTIWCGPDFVVVGNAFLIYSVLWERLLLTGIYDDDKEGIASTAQAW
ncbi:unnamed protein product, partial [Allacma fusca]